MPLTKVVSVTHMLDFIVEPKRKVKELSGELLKAVLYKVKNNKFTHPNQSQIYTH